MERYWWRANNEKTNSNNMGNGNLSTIYPMQLYFLWSQSKTKYRKINKKMGSAAVAAAAAADAFKFPFT